MSIPLETDREWFALLSKAGLLLSADGQELAEGTSDIEARLMLMLLLNHKYPGWMQNPRLKEVIVNRVKEVGVATALTTMVREGLS